MGPLELYNYLIYECGDPRNRGHLLTDTPWFVLGTVTLYWLFIRKIGPRLMEKREPFQIDGIIKIYNVIQIVWNLYIFAHIRFVVYGYHEGLCCWWCLPLSFGNDKYSLTFRYVVHQYFFNKLFDLMDTVFFVLRKKFKQITFTHVFHHISMAIGTWIGLKYAPGGNVCYGGGFNNLVHCLMYTYYFLALDGRRVWWKKHLTQLQIVQFLFAIVSSSIVFFNNVCNNNLYLTGAYIIQGSYFVFLFTKFYIKNYVNPSKRNARDGANNERNRICKSSIKNK